MNIPLIMTPKIKLATLYDDYTIRQALEKMHYHGYTAIPVIDRNNKYMGTLSEGELLWFIYKDGDEPRIDLSCLHTCHVRDILNKERYAAVTIDASPETVFERAMNQNFVPVVDDRGCLSGIVTRRDVIKSMLV